MSSDFPFKVPPAGEVHSTVLGPEFFEPSTGGRPPRTQVARMARRKSDPEPEPSPDAGEPSKSSTLDNYPFAQRQFEDHDGNQCISVWDEQLKVEKAGKSFPPPWNYQVYVTFGSTTQSPGIAKWCNEFYNYFLRAATGYLFAGVRLDFIFIPSASPWKCVQHYRLEKKVRAETDIPLVPTYETQDMGPRDAQQNALLILNDEDIAGKGLKFIRFDASASDLLRPESDAVAWIDRLSERFYLYEQPRPAGMGTVLEPLEQLYKLSQIRARLEKEFRIAKQEAEERKYPGSS